jgi:mono/diheme cytochrome c family protein
MLRFVQGLIVGASLVPLAVLLWLNSDKVPVAVKDQSLPYEQWIVNLPLANRIQRELKSQPIKADEKALMSGASLYSEQCAACHGLYGKPSTIAEHMYPSPPSLWDKQTNGDAVGVSNELSATIYWKVSNGVRLSGMPAFEHQLTDNEIWQISLLLSNADKPLPPAAINILRGKKIAETSLSTQASIAKENMLRP